MRFTRKVLRAAFRKARRLIVKGWTRDSWARLRNGDGVRYDDPRACKFCALGAINVAAGVHSDAYLSDPKIEAKAIALAETMEERIIDTLLGTDEETSSVVVWNDRQTRKKVVLKKFDEIIAGLK